MITWSLLVVGLTYAVTTSFVFALPRMLISRLGLFTKYFVYCPWCVSFWAGAATSTIYTTEQVGTLEWFGTLIVMGFVAMGLVSVLKAAFPTILVPPFEAEQGPDEDQISVGDPENVKGPVETCPHRYTNVGPDRRCILCGADEGT